MRTKTLLSIVILFGFSIGNSYSQPWENGPLKVSENGHFLIHENDTSFFFLGCTAWRMVNKLSKDEIDFYFSKRSEQGFNVVMFTAGNGFALDINEKNYYGHTPFVDSDSLEIKRVEGDDNDWWDYILWIVKKAGEYGMYAGLTPAFSGNYDAFDTKEKCEAYASFLATLLKDQPNIIWVAGGDAAGSYKYSYYHETIPEMLDSCDKNHLITFHPVGPGQSSTHYHEKEWLDFNACQTGHFRRDDPKLFTFPYSDWNLTPPKPVIDIEFAYENHPVRQQSGKFTAYDIRQKAYWSVFGGSCGLGYGHYEIWRFNYVAKEGEPHWKEALKADGANQLKYLKELLYSQEYTERIPDFGLVENSGLGPDHVVGTRGKDYAFIYIPTGKPIKVIMGKIKGLKVRASWFNPRNGQKTPFGTFKNKGITKFTPPLGTDQEKDYVLVLESYRK